MSGTTRLQWTDLTDGEVKYGPDLPCSVTHCIGVVGGGNLWIVPQDGKAMYSIPVGNIVEEPAMTDVPRTYYGAVQVYDFTTKLATAQVEFTDSGYKPESAIITRSATPYIWTLDMDNGRIIEYDIDGLNKAIYTLSLDRPRSLCQLSTGEVFVLCADGVAEFTDAGVLTTIHEDKAVLCKYGNKIRVDDSDKMWILAWNKFWKFDPVTNLYTNFMDDYDTYYRIQTRAPHFCTDFCIDGNGKIVRSWSWKQSYIAGNQHHLYDYFTVDTLA